MTLSEIKSNIKKLEDRKMDMIVNPSSYNVSGGVAITERQISELDNEINRLKRLLLSTIGGGIKTTPYYY